MHIVIDDGKLALRVNVIVVAGHPVDTRTQEPKSRVRRIIGNIEISQTDDGMIEVGANFQATEVRVNVNTPFFWHGRYIYRLRPEGDDFRIRLKKVLLLNNDQEMTQLTFLV